MEQPFVINERFLVNPSLNLVRDLQSQAETQLEPRLMKVLCILARHAGRLVSRNNLTEQVWNDYGGADEGLTQSVSFLRKALDDQSRHLIKTISGKGYIMQAVISSAETIATSITLPQKKTWFKTAGAVAVLLMGVIYVVLQFTIPDDDDIIRRKKTGAGKESVKESTVEKLKPSERPTGSDESNSPKNKISGPGNKKDGATRTKKDLTGNGKKVTK